MSEQSLDNLIYQINSSDSVREVPYLKKEWGWTTDNNFGGVYDVNQIEFTTTSFSANGEFCSYREGFFVFPVIFAISGANVGGAVDFTATFTDCCMAIKNSYHQLIHSCQIFYSNGQVVQQQPYINQYISFIQNTTFNQEEIDSVGNIIGFQKNTPDAWGYNPDGAGGGTYGEGLGLYNNVSSTNSHRSIFLSPSEVINDGLTKRTMLFNDCDSTSDGKSNILGTTLQLEKGINRIEKTATAMAYHANAVIKLSDLSSFFANMPMTMGSIVRILLTMNNNISFSFTKNATGDLALVANSFQNSSGLTNPLMVSASNTIIKGLQTPIITTLSRTDVNPVSDAHPPSIIVVANGAPAVADQTICSGSYGLPTATYSVKMGLAKLEFGGSVFTHKLSRCRLYLPSYVFNPEYATQYLASPKRTIKYNDVYYSNFVAKGSGGGTAQQFQARISASVARAKRLIMISTLQSPDNANTVHSLTSPFYDNCSACVPYTINNFEVLVANKNVYTNQMLYTYEEFIREMGLSGGIYGLNGGQVCGASAGLIDLKAYNNNMKYIVVDLSRKLEADEMVGTSIEVRGNLSSPKDIQFFCFIEVSRDITIDVGSGNVVA